MFNDSKKLSIFAMTLGLTIFSSNVFACKYKVKDNSDDGYACAKKDSKGNLFTKKKDNSHDGYKVVKHGKASNYYKKKGKKHGGGNHSGGHYGGSYNGGGYYSGGSYGGGYYSGGSYGGGSYSSSSTYSSGSVYTSCAPDMVESNVIKTDKLAKSFLDDKRFSEERRFNAALNGILSIKSDQEKLGAYFGLVNVETPQDIAFFVGARKDEYGRYETNLIQNTELDPALAKEVVAKLIDNIKGQ